MCNHSGVDHLTTRITKDRFHQTTRFLLLCAWARSDDNASDSFDVLKQNQYRSGNTATSRWQREIWFADPVSSDVFWEIYGIWFRHKFSLYLFVLPFWFLHVTKCIYYLTIFSYLSLLYFVIWCISTKVLRHRQIQYFRCEKKCSSKVSRDGFLKVLRDLNRVSWHARRQMIFVNVFEFAVHKWEDMLKTFYPVLNWSKFWRYPFKFWSSFIIIRYNKRFPKIIIKCIGCVCNNVFAFKSQPRPVALTVALQLYSLNLIWKWSFVRVSLLIPHSRFLSFILHAFYRINDETS